MTIKKSSFRNGSKFMYLSCNNNNSIAFHKKRDAVLCCILFNFRMLEKETPFYDEYNQIGNNYYFNETPRYNFESKYPFIKWLDHRTISEKNNFRKYSTETLECILDFQNKLIIPQNNDYEMKTLRIIRIN